MTKVDFDDQILKKRLNSADDVESATARDCIVMFKKYAEIVKHFTQKKNRLQKIKSGLEYRLAIKNQDEQRRTAHNACLNDILVINRISHGKFIKTDCPLADLTRSDYGKAILNFVQRCSKYF